MSLKSNNIEEEMRTFYVALTRAKQRLYITYHLYEEYGRENKISRFINFINKEHMDNDY